jgi:hypothetical protein
MVNLALASVLSPGLARSERTLRNCAAVTPTAQLQMATWKLLDLRPHRGETAWVPVLSPGPAHSERALRNCATATPTAQMRYACCGMGTPDPSAIAGGGSGSAYAVPANARAILWK